MKKKSYLLIMLLSLFIFMANVKADNEVEWSVGTGESQNGSISEAISNNIDISEISEMEFINNQGNAVDCSNSLDLSKEGESNQVIACEITNDDVIQGIAEPKTLIIHFNGKLKINNANSMFVGFDNLASIEGLNNIDTSTVTSMEKMFFNLKKLVSFDIDLLDTSSVENMSYMFAGMQAMTTLYLSNFNTSKVTNMQGMFKDTKALVSLNINDFNTSLVQDMSYMFSNTNLSTLNTKALNTSSVTNMDRMFANSKKFTTIDLSTFDTSSVTSMDGMFLNTKLESLDLSNFNTSKVEKMTYMFCGMKNISSLDLKSFNTAKVTNMSYMFKDMELLESLDISSFRTPLLVSMEQTFYGLKKLKSLDLSNFNTSLVSTNMSSLFYNDSSLTNLNLTGFNTSNTLEMVSMFEGVSSLQRLDLSSFNTSSVTDMANMFKGMTSLEELDVTSFNTSNVVGMNSMFEGTAIEILNISSFNTVKVIDMRSMFSSMTKLKKIYVGEGWTTAAETATLEDGSYVFSGNDNLVGENGTTYSDDNRGISYAKIDVEDFPGYLSNIANYRPITGIEFANASIILEVNQSKTIFVRLLPADTSEDTTITCTIGNEEIASIKNGVITGISVGNTTVTATTKEGKTATIPVYVTKQIDSIQIDNPKVTLNVGQQETLTVTINPSNTTFSKKITWSSSDDSIASVNENGTVTARKAGVVTITAKSSNNLTSTSVITVTNSITSIYLSKTNLSLSVNESQTVTATVNPSDTPDDKTLTWSSNDNSIASVDQNGKITAKKIGSAIITVKSSNNITSSIYVNVVDPITSIKLNVSKVYIQEKKKYNLIATLYPTTIKDDNLTWTSDNTKVATVNSNGVITAKKIGTAKITVKTSNGKSAKVKVIVTATIKKASITGIKDLTYTGNNITQDFTVKYNGTKLKLGTDYTVTYKDNKKIGKATITIKGKENYTDSIKKTFYILPKKTSLSMLTSKSKSLIISWKKQTSNTTGYQIKYSLNSDFSNSTKVLVKNNKTTSKEINKLKGNKKYYVKIRTYKVVDGQKIYSNWSKVLNAKTKK